VSQIV